MNHGRSLLILALNLLIGSPVLHGQAAPGPQQINAALTNPAFVWEEAESENFRIYYLPDTLTATGVEAVRRGLEISFAENLALIGETDATGEPVRALFVSSRAQMAEIVGAPYGGAALVDEHGLVFVALPSGRAAIRHELMHLISHEQWGTPHAPGAWLSEGLATFAPGHCAGYSIRSIGALMDRSGQLPSLQDLTFRFTSISDLYSYLAGASFVEFVLSEYGLDTLRQIWREGLESPLPVTVGELDTSWRDFVARSEAASASAWDEIRGSGCE